MCICVYVYMCICICVYVYMCICVCVKKIKDVYMQIAYKFAYKHICYLLCIRIVLHYIS